MLSKYVADPTNILKYLKVLYTPNLREEVYQ